MPCLTTRGMVGKFLAAFDNRFLRLIVSRYGLYSSKLPGSPLKPGPHEDVRAVELIWKYISWCNMVGKPGKAIMDHNG